MSDFRKEAEVLGKYLLGGKKPNAESISLYENANQIKPVSLNEREKKILAFLLRHPACAGLIDGALAFGSANGGIRRKILYMSAILETQPEYADLFLPKERGWFFNIYIFWVGCRAILKAIAGKVLLLFV